MRKAICLAAIFLVSMISQASAGTANSAISPSAAVQPDVAVGMEPAQEPDETNKAEFMLSFDDGPLPDATGRVLDSLATIRADDGRPVKAAFFLLADAPDDFWQRRLYFAFYEARTEKGSIAKYPEIVRRIVRAGHLVGNHTAHHAWFWWPWLNTHEAVRSELIEWEAIAQPVLGTINPRLFRPPYSVTTETEREVAAQLGYKIVLGEAVGDTLLGTEVQDIEERAQSILAAWHQPFPCVLIFHDIQPDTSAHLGEIVDELQRQGFRLVHFDPGRL